MSKELVANAINYLEFMAREQRNNFLITEPSQVKKYFKLKLDEHRDREHFDVITLTSRHALIGYYRLFSGTIDGSEVHPRVVIRQALLDNAAAIIIAHNHPSGALQFSTADRKLTSRLQDACHMFDIRLLDHILVGCGEGVVAASEQGWL
jgi:DNA repair protein RadC